MARQKDRVNKLRMPAGTRLTEKELLRLLNPDENLVTLETIRQKVSQAAEAFFGRPILIEERAYQALEVTRMYRRTPSPAAIWTQLERTLPAISSMYETLRISPTFRSPAYPIDLDVQDLDLLDYQKLMEWIFVVHGFESRPRLSDAGMHIQLTGKITVQDLVLAILQSGRQRANLPIRRMAEGTPLGKKTVWTDGLRRLAEEATNTFGRLYECDPSYGDQQFILYHDGRNVRVQPFATAGLHRLQEAPLPDGSLWIARGNTLQPSKRFSEKAITGLEDLINRNAKEADFQQFFEQHSEFLLAFGEYVKLHPQLVLAEDDGRSLIPDFFLEKMDSGFCDICDLKRPTAQLVRYQHNRHRFRDAVMEAVAQLGAYKDWFDDAANRQTFRERYGLKAYKPRVVVVIGRRLAFEDDVRRIALESRLPSWITLKTYDDVVAGARRWRNFALESS